MMKDIRNKKTLKMKKKEKKYRRKWINKENKYKKRKKNMISLIENLEKILKKKQILRNKEINYNFLNSLHKKAKKQKKK